MTALLDSVPAEMVARIRAGLLQLRPAEIIVLREAMKGGSDAEIAAALGLKLATITVQLRNIRLRTKSSRFELMRGVFELRDDAVVEAYLENPVLRRRGPAQKR